MAHNRGGVFRSRFIAFASQRAKEILSKPAVAQATLDYEATAHSLATTVVDNQVVTFTPLTVENAVGKERLAVLGGFSGSPLADFDACTIDGQAATRVGAVSRSTGTAHFVVVSGDSGLVATVNFGATAFTGTAPAGFSAWGSGTTLNPSDKKSSLVVLSGGNLTVTGNDSVNNWVRSTTAQTGKRYVEFTMTAGTNDVIGIADQSTLTFPGSNSHSFGLFSNGYGSIAGVFPNWLTLYAAGNVVCMAVDLDAKLVWFRVGAGGDWNGGPLGNPATGAGGISVSAYVSAAVTFVTAYRAPGTSNTAINVAATADLGGSSDSITNSYCATFKLSNAGTLVATTLSASNDPTLSANTVVNGAVVSGLTGYGYGLLSGSGFVGWTGLTERLEDNGSADLVFSVASANISSASTPLAISADLTPNLTASGNSTASIAISFNPIPVRSVPANAGSYAIGGTGVAMLITRRLVAAAGSYSMTGTTTTLRLGHRLVADVGSYAMTGNAAALSPSAGATAAIVFDAAAADASDVAHNSNYTFPLTVASSVGERLVVIGGVAGTDGDFDQCTIDGQTGTRVGTTSVGVADSNGYASFLTSYRAAGTAATSINVVARVGGSLKTQTAGYCAGFKLNGAGNVHASTNNNLSDPVLSTDTVNNGVAVGALLGYCGAIAQTGTTLTLHDSGGGIGDTNTGTAFPSITVPVDADIILVGVSAYQGTVDGLESLTFPKGGVDTAMTKVTGGDSSTSVWQAALFYLTLPDTGAGKEIKWDWIGTGTSGDASLLFSITFWKGINAASPVRSSTGTQGGSFPITTSSLTATTGDKIVAWFGGYSPSAEGSIDSWSNVSTLTNVPWDGTHVDGAWATGNPSGSTTIAASTATTFTQGGLCALVLKPAAPTVSWTGLTEQFDAVRAGTTDVFSGASADTATGSLPLDIVADATNDFSGSNDSVASLCISFLPGGAALNVITANIGTYTITGTAAVPKLGRKTVAASGSYAITGTAVTLRTFLQLTVDPGSYALTGSTAALFKSGTNRVLDATTAGSYVLTGTDAALKRGKKATVTTVGSYGITGTTVTTGKGLIAAAGSYVLTGTGATPIKTIGPNISFSVGGNQMTASPGSVSVSGGTGSGIATTGNQMTMSVGNVSVSSSGGISVPVTMTELTASVGTAAVSILGGIDVHPIGLEVTASVGTAEVTIPGQTPISAMDAMTMSAGSVQVQLPGGVYVGELYGNYMTMSVGDLSVSTSNNIEVTGDAMTASVGSVTTGANVSADVTSPTMTASVGTVTVTAKQVVSVSVTGNAMTAYVGNLRFVGGGTVVLFPDQTKEGQMLKPSNWMGG